MPTYKQLLKINRKAILGLEKEALLEMRRLFIISINELYADLKRFAADKDMSYTAYWQKQTLAQLQDGVDALETILTRDGTAYIKQSYKTGTEQLFAEIAKGNAQFLGSDIPLPVDLAKKVGGVTDKVLLQRYDSSVKRYGEDLIKVFREKLAVGQLKGLSTSEAIQSVFKAGTEVQDWQLWKSERIVRTEIHDAASRGRLESMKESQKVFGDLEKVWSATSDQRVGDDSKFLDGQRVPVDGMFTEINGGKIARPVHRPQDRCAIFTWRKEWGDDPSQA